MTEIKTYRITLVIPTYNGEKTLRKLIDSINALRLPSGVDFSVVFIDNNSKDKTEAILSGAKFCYPVRTLFEEKQGKNAALNSIFRGRVDIGDLLIFSDDDVIFPENFIERYHWALQQFPNVHLFGGAIEAHWVKKPPENLVLGIDSVVAFAITPMERKYISGPIDPVKLHGPNMAIRSSVFFDGIRFNEGIGPNGKNYMMGSETELLYRLRDLGYTAYFDASNVVSHIVWPEQLESRWLKNRAYRAGRSLMMHQEKMGVDIKCAEIFGYPRWAIYKIFKLMFRKLFRFNNDVFQYRALWEISHLKGYCDEYRTRPKR